MELTRLSHLILIRLVKKGDQGHPPSQLNQYRDANLREKHDAGINEDRHLWKFDYVPKMV